MPFSDRATQRNLVLALTESSEVSRGSNIDVLLDEAAATDSLGVTQYRPYYVAAKELAMSPAVQKIESGKGATFTGMVKPIASMLDTQRDLDAKYAWTIPPGFEVTTDDYLDPKARCECSGSITGSGIFPVIATTSVKATVHP